MYDYLIVGAGLFGSVFARQVADSGQSVFVIDKRNHIGGNCYSEKIRDIDVHKYGPHIFHTSSDKVWNYIKNFTNFNQYIYSPVANYKGELYNLPFNMWTFYQLWGVKTPVEAKAKIESQKIFIRQPNNLEDYAVQTVGEDIYRKLIYGYTSKQWHTSPLHLPTDIIKRIPLRFEYNNNYFNDKYQGIPREGYTNLFYNLLCNIPVELGVDFFANRDRYESIAKRVVYTGRIDQFFNYQFGELDYRSLRFEHQVLDIDNFQGISVMNFTDKETAYTRRIEHKHFNNKNQKSTIITTEYPVMNNSDPYYPVNDKKNNEKLVQYEKLCKINRKFIFGGRLAEYRYYDMDQTIASALKKSELTLR
jgi:UDP-galactopyranose mutase